MDKLIQYKIDDLFAGAYFDITKVSKLLTALGLESKVLREQYRILRLYHCTKWITLSDEIIEEIKLRVSVLLEITDENL